MHTSFDRGTALLRHVSPLSQFHHLINALVGIDELILLCSLLGSAIQSAFVLLNNVLVGIEILFNFCSHLGLAIQFAFLPLNNFLVWIEILFNFAAT